MPFFPRQPRRSRLAASLRHALFLAFAAALSPLKAQTTPNNVQYTVTDLGGLGAPGTYSAALSNDGKVIGYSFDSTGRYTGFTFQNATLAPLFANTPGASSVALAIAPNGYIAGGAQTGPGSQFRAVLMKNDTAYDIGLPTGFTEAVARGVNSSSQIVGYADVAGFGRDNHAFLFSKGTLTDINTLGGSTSVANAINEKGQVVGTADVYGNTATHAFRYQNGLIQDLNVLPGDKNSTATAINYAGQIVGTSTDAAGHEHAFLYQRSAATRQEAFTALGTLPGGTNSAAYSLNSAGVIVGSASPAGQPSLRHAMLYIYNVMYDLNTLLPPGSPVLIRATAINDRGFIVAQSADNHAYLLKPIVIGYDYNNDRRSDIAWQNVNTNDAQTWGLYYSNFISIGAKTTIQGATTQPLSATIVSSADFDADGYADFVWQDSATNETSIWYWSNGGVRGRAPIVAPNTISTKYHIIGSADVTGDGLPDLLWRNTETGDVIYWQMVNNQRVSDGFLAYAIPLDYNLVGVGDFDGDGYADLVWQSATTKQTYVWYMKGLSIGSVALLIPANGPSGTEGNIPDTANIEGCPDLNGDRKPDLLWRDASNNDVYVWLMNNTVRINPTNTLYIRDRDKDGNYAPVSLSSRLIPLH